MHTTTDTASRPRPAASLPQAARHALSDRSLALALLVVLAAAGGVYAVLAGQDFNYDQRNYHRYTLYQLFNGREDFDYAPGGRNVSWLISYWNLPWYVLHDRVPAAVVGFVLGAGSGLVVWTAALVAWRVLRRVDRPWRIVLTLAAMGVGASGAGTRTEFGTTFGNLATALPVLLAILLFVGKPDGPLQPRRAAAIGALLGVAVALKFTNGMFGVAFVAAWLICRRPRRSDLLSLVTFSAAGVAGVLAVNGYWMWRLWTMYGNPLFPFYNETFGSPYAPEENIKDVRWIPETLGEAVSLPWRMASLGPTVGPLDSRDPRWIVLAVLAGLALLVVLARRVLGAARRPDDGLVSAEHRRFLLAFVGVSFLLWDYMFSIGRYLPPIELLSGLALLVLLDLLLTRRRLVGASFLAIGAAISSTVVSADFQRFPYGERWYEMSVPPIADPDDTVILLPAGRAISYVVPSFPEEVRFVRPVIDGANPTLLTIEAQRVVREFDGTILALIQPGQLEAAERHLTRVGLRRGEDCREFHTGFEPVMLCPVAELSPG